MPTYFEVEQRIRPSDPNFDLTKLTQERYNSFRGQEVVYAKGKASIKLTDIFISENSFQDIDDFVRAARYCEERYCKAGVALPRITSEEIQNDLGLSALSARKVGLLIYLEGLAQCDEKKKSENGWIYIFDKEIAPFSQNETFVDYIERRDNLEESKGNI